MKVRSLKCSFPCCLRPCFPPRVTGHFSLLCWAVLSLGEGKLIFFCCFGLAGRGLYTVGGGGSGGGGGGGEGGSLIIQPFSIATAAAQSQNIIHRERSKTTPIYEIQFNPCIHSNFKATRFEHRARSIKQCLKEVCMRDVTCDLFCNTCIQAQYVTHITNKG